MSPELQNNQNAEKWLSMAEASKFAPYSAEYLSLLARRGKLTSKKVGNVWYTTKPILESYMAKQMVREQALKGNLPEKISPVRSYFGDLKEFAEESGLDIAPPVLEKKREHKETHEPLFRSLSRMWSKENLEPEVFLPARDVAQREKIDLEKTFFAKAVPMREAHMSAPSAPTHEVEQALERVLDRKRGATTLVDAEVEEEIFSRATYKKVFTSKILVAVMVLLVISLTALPVPVVFSFFDKSFTAIRDAISDSTTVMGFRPGTHENELLLLDSEGNVSIMGHIETEGQLRSYAADGIAPIVVDSMTMVENLNAEFLGGASSTDFTLAFVTANGNVTTEDVYLEGKVEVGSTLLVRGATQLLSTLSVGGDLKVFGNAEFKKVLTAVGPAYFESLVTMQDDLIAQGDVSVSGDLRSTNIYAIGGIEARSVVASGSGIFGSLSSDGSLSARGDISLGGSESDVSIQGEHMSIDNGSASFDGMVSATTLTATYSSTTNATSTNLYAENANFGNINGGVITLSNLNFTNATGTSATTTNFFSTNATFTNLNVEDIDLTELVFENATGTNATTTNFFTNTLTAVLATITSIIADDISTDALTATDAEIINSTTTNATTTNLFSASASSTNLFSTTGNIGTLAAGNVTVSGDTSLQDFTFANATGTSATTTNFFSSNGTFTNLFADALDLTDFTFVNATGTNATTTNLAVSNSFYTSLTAGSVPFIGTNGLLTEDNSNLFWNSTTNRLGIGTTEPSSKLSIQGSGSATLNVLDLQNDEGAAIGNSVGASFQLNNYPGEMREYGSIKVVSTDPTNTSRDGRMDFGVVNSTIAPNTLETVMSLVGGSVGIGTTDPGSKLHVEGTGAQAVMVESTDNTSASLALVRSGVGSGDFRLINDAGTFKLQYDLAEAWGSTFMTIMNSGNVGIADSSPDAKLEVVGDLMISSADGGNGDRFIVNTSGDVGIGTTTPSVKFSVGGLAGDTTGHGYFTGGLGIGVVNTTAGTIETSGSVTVGGSLTVNGSLTSSITNGQIQFLANPTGTAIDEGGVYINPTSAGTNNVLLGIAVNGVEALRIDAEGDVQAVGVFNSTNTTGTNEFSGHLSVDGNTTIGDTSADTVTFNSLISSNLVPSADNTYSLGTTTSRWANFHATSAFFDTITTASSTEETFVINSDNATADAEDSSLQFERGTEEPNAIIKWDSALTRFDFNDFAVHLQNVLHVSGTASSTFAGPLWITGGPEGTGLADASLYINPSAAAADESLFSVAVNAVERFRVDAEGDTTVQASLGIENALYDITEDTLTINDSLQIIGDEIKGSDDVTRITLGATNTLTGALEVTGTPFTLSAASAVLDFSSATGVKQIQTGGSTNLALMPGGNVGIGTTDPLSKLEVQHSSSNHTNGLTITNEEDWGFGSRILFRTPLTSGAAVGDAASINQGIQSSNNYNLSFHTTGGGTLAERMRITATGDVGVGVTNPASRFEVSHATSNHTNGLTITNTEDWGFGSRIVFKTPLTSGGAVGEAASINQSFDSSNNYHLAFHTTGSGTLAERMRITSGGNVGIGTTNPTHKLYVSGSQPSILIDNTIGGANDKKIRIRAHDGLLDFESLTDAENPLVDNLLVMDLSSGKVGIGNAAPNKQLTVTGDIAATTGYYYGTVESPVNLEVTRTLPTTVNDYVEIGSFAANGGAHNIRISITTNHSSVLFSTSRTYVIPTEYANTSSAWGEVIPQMDTGENNGNNYALDMRMVNSTLELRLRRTVGSTPDTAYVRIESVGRSGNAFTASTATGSTSAPNFKYGALYQFIGTFVYNVGIGTTNPLGKFHTYESDAKTATNYSAYFQNVSTNTNTNGIDKYGAYITSTGTFTGSTGTATNNYGLYVDTPTGADNNYAAIFEGGNVGIGTTNPVKTLDVSFSDTGTDVTANVGSTARGGLFIDNVSTTNNSFANLDFESRAAGGRIALSNDAGTLESDFHFVLSNSAGTRMDRMVIDGETGNLGIGSTTPFAKLSITNTGTGPSFVVEDNSSPDSTQFLINAAGTVVIGHDTPLTSPPFTGGKLQVLGDSQLNSTITAARFTDDTGGAVFELIKSRSASILGNTIVQDGDTLGTIRFRGTVGEPFSGSIGATISAIVDDDPGVNDMPTSLVFGTTDNNDPSPTERMRITHGGLVGIGTTGPQGRLHIADSANDADMLIVGDVNDDATLFLLEDFNQGTATRFGGFIRNDGAASASTLNFGTISNDVETNTLTLQSGNVGIGTTEPSEKLHVSGNLLVTGNSTTTNATTTNFFSTLGTFTSLVADSMSVDALESGHITPLSDDTYDLGSASLRWQDVYVGPTSLHIYSTAAETGTARDWTLGISEADDEAEGNLRIGLAGASTFNFTPDGELGIGTTDPRAMLQLDKSTSGTNVASGTALRIQAGGGLGERAEIGFSYYTSPGTIPPVTIGYRNTAFTGFTKGAFFVATRDATTDTELTERLTVAPSGMVGIGNTNPTEAELSVTGGGYFSGGLSAGDTTVTSGVVNAGTGFRVANAAGSGAILKGNGTNFVAASAGALTKTDDTNVTITLGGTPNTALLEAVSLTLGWTGELAVTRGGTGAATLTQNGVLYGNGTSAIQATAEGGANTILTANAGAPSFSASPTIGTSVTTPLIIGGTAADSSLELRSTSGSGTTDFIKFTTGSNGATEAMRVVSSGNIGIGATEPLTKLQVDDSTSGTGVASGTAFRVQAGQNANERSEIGFSYYTSPGVNPPVVIGYQATAFTGFTNGPFYIATRSVTTDTAPTIRMQIMPDGKIGVGTTAPGMQFEINSADGNNLRLTYNDADGSAANYTDFILGTDGALTITPANTATTTIANGLVVNTDDLIVQNATGNIGIGTTDPGRLLSVFHATTDRLLRLESGDATASFELIDTNGTSVIEQNSFGLSLSADAGTTDHLLIDTSGNVGIGTTNPDGQLTVSGVEGVSGVINIWADDGDDNADKWRAVGGNGGIFSIDKFSTGSWVSSLTIDGSSNVAIAGTITEAGSPVISNANIDTCAEFIALVVSTGTCGSTVFSVSPTLTGTLTAAAANFSGAVSTGALTATTLDTGQGANELYDMNQNVLTTSRPTFTDIDNAQWFRNNDSGEGLYNTANDAHFYSAGDNYWHINPNDGLTTGGLVFYTGHNPTQGHATGRQGYVYFDTSGFGLLNSDGQWAVQTTPTATNLYYDAAMKLATNSGGVTITGTASATTFSGAGTSLTGTAASLTSGNTNACSADGTCEMAAATLSGALSSGSSSFRFNSGYADFRMGSENSGNYGLLVYGNGATDTYMNIQARGGIVYLADTATYSGHFLSANGTAVTMPGTVSTGALTVTTINSGQGATEVHLMNQNVRTSDSPTFSSINASNTTTSAVFAGSVGIGPGTPQYAGNVKLDIRGVNPLNGILQVIANTAGSGWTGAQIQFSQNGLADWVIGQPAGTDAFSFFQGRYSENAGQEMMRLDNGGILSLLNTSSGALQLPELTSAGAGACTNGKIVFNQDSGEDGTLFYCRQNSGGTLGWRMIASASATPDLAEYVRVSDTSIEAGDVISVSEEDYYEENIYNRFLAEKSDSSNKERVLGIVSTEPGLILNESNSPHVTIDKTYNKPLTVAGRVPVKVTNENGPIMPGDYLTVSDTVPGHATKAVTDGLVIAKALDDFDEETGQVLVFIVHTYYSPGLEEVKENLAQVVDAIGLDLTATSTGLTIDRPVVLGGGLEVDHISAVTDLVTIASAVEFIGRPYFNNDTGGLAVIEKGSRQVDITFDEPYIEAPVVNSTIAYATDGIGDGEVLAATSAEIDAVLGSSLKYVVVNRSGSGFSILLAEPASERIEFSWIALAIKNIRLASSADTTQPEANDPAPSTNEPTTTTDTSTTDNSTTDMATTTDSTATTTDTTTDTSTTDTTASTTDSTTSAGTTDTPTTDTSSTDTTTDSSSTSEPTADTGTTDTTTADDSTADTSTDSSSTSEPTTDTSTDPSTTDTTTEPEPAPSDTSSDTTVATTE